MNLILKLDNAFQLKILKHFQNLWLSLIFQPYFLFGSSLFAVQNFKSGNLVNKLERASHISKDAGEICACVGGVLLFWGIFHEAAMANAFKYIFMAYLYGHLTAFILVTVVNFHKTKEENNALN